MKLRQSSLFYVFVAVFSLDCAQTTIGLEFCMNNYPIEMLTFKSLSHSKTTDCARL